MFALQAMHDMVTNHVITQDPINGLLVVNGEQVYVIPWTHTTESPLTESTLCMMPNTTLVLSV